MKTVDYVQLWHDDKQSMLATMYTNLASDLRNGYNPFGKSALTQKAYIAAYENEYAVQSKALLAKDEKAARKWAYHDLRRRGVIA